MLSLLVVELATSWGVLIVISRFLYLMTSSGTLLLIICFSEITCQTSHGWKPIWLPVQVGIRSSCFIWILSLMNGLFLEWFMAFLIELLLYGWASLFNVATRIWRGRKFIVTYKCEIKLGSPGLKPNTLPTKPPFLPPKSGSGLLLVTYWKVNCTFFNLKPWHHPIVSCASVSPVTRRSSGHQ